MSRDEIIAALGDLGVKRDRATQYFDAYEEYRLASENIEKNGPIVQHPRTAQPMENPFLKVRDRALAKLGGMRDVPAHKVAGLW